VDVLEEVARQKNWDAIVRNWRGSFTKEAIAEAVRLAGRHFLEQARSYPHVETRPA
jgi:hypothetical protein